MDASPVMPFGQRIKTRQRLLSSPDSTQNGDVVIGEKTGGFTEPEMLDEVSEVLDSLETIINKAEMRNISASINEIEKMERSLS